VAGTTPLEVLVSPAIVHADYAPRLGYGDTRRLPQRRLLANIMANATC